MECVERNKVVSKLHISRNEVIVKWNTDVEVNVKTNPLSVIVERQSETYSHFQFLSFVVIK